MRHKATRALFAYWDELRGERLAPRRFEIEPARLGEALPDTFILERQSAGTFPFRLAGTRICDRFEREFRGHNFLGEWPARDRQTVAARLNTVSVQGGGVLVLANAETATGKSVLVEMVILPLLHCQAYADRFVGILVPLDTPDWLDWEPLVSMHLISEEIIWPGAPSAEAGDFPFDDRQSPLLPSVRHATIVRSDRRHFRVFDGGLSLAQNGKP